MRIDHLLVTVPRCLGRNRSRGTEGKASTIGSPTDRSLSE